MYVTVDLDTTIPHQKLKSRLTTIIRNSFIHKNGNWRLIFLDLGREGPYFVKAHSDLSSNSQRDTSMTYCQSITQTLRIIWVKYITLSLRSKTRRIATPLLPTWVYSCRSRVTVNCTLPFTTNLTISTSLSQTFRSWEAIFHLRQPMVCLSHSSHGMPGLALLMNVLF